MSMSNTCTLAPLTPPLNIPRSTPDTVYDRIDAAATIHFCTQFGAATIRERRLFRSARVQAQKNVSEKVNISTRIVY